MKVAIAGASGFIGSHIIPSLIEAYPEIQIKALSRREKETSKKNISWVQCDLFSLKDTTSALEGCDIAIFLVHSMLPSAKLTQGDFPDFDLMIADNFARAARKNNIKQIIYLSGIIPDGVKLSKHLSSRLEVEKALNSSNIPITTLRAGLVLGPGGSSFNIMYRLVKKLPVMITPKWTRSLSSATSIWDIQKLMVQILGNPTYFNKTYDVSSGEIISYQDMMRILAEEMKKKRFFIGVPFISPYFSRLWVVLVTRAPKNLVYPLISSLKEHMVADPLKTIKREDGRYLSYREAIRRTLKEQENIKTEPHAYVNYDEVVNDVRSFQRLNTIGRTNAFRLSRVYFKWISKVFKGIIKVLNEGNEYHFHLIGLKKPLLTFEFSPEISDEERQIFYIRGGLLAYGDGRGRLEFRSIINRRYIIAAIHEFRPKLPWYIYKYTQALFHLYVMRKFDQYLVYKKY